MAERFIQRADDALKTKDFQTALGLSESAIAADPTKYRPYLQKSIAAQRLQKYQESFNASETAIANAYNLGRREAIADGQLRRGIALYYLKRYADADQSFDLAKQYGSKDKSLDIWKSKVDDKLENAGDDERTVAIEDIPTDAMVKVAPANKIEELPDNDEDVKEALKEKQEFTKAVAAPKIVEYTQDVRRDWYQNKTTVNVSLFLKNAPKDKTSVEFSETQAVISTVQPKDGTTSFEYTLGPFTNPIDASNSSFKVFGTKLELTLVKSDNANWKDLTSNEAAGEQVTLDDMRAALNEPKLPPVNGQKNWDKLAEDEWESLTKEDKVKDDSDDFFKTLFANADEDTKRAMMKSYTESNGTALSTDWSEVKNKVYPVDPPTGMEARPYPT